MANVGDMEWGDGMVDREKVIKGLEIARKLAWNGEHCNIMDADDALTVSYAITDALTLLKAQEPRVMTLEEVLALPHDTPVYIENRDTLNGWDVYAGITKDADKDVVTGAVWATCEYWPQDEYGDTWRVWTSRPTDEQREATPWMT